MKLVHQSVVILGDSSGIGLATARLILERGGRLIIVGRDAAKLTAARETLGAGAESMIADATDRAALDALFGRLGSVDHLVLAASGGRGAGAFADLSLEGLRGGFEAKF